jgi:hypothetical protein
MGGLLYIYTLCSNPNLFLEAHCFEKKFNDKEAVEEEANISEHPFIAYLTQGHNTGSDSEESLSKTCSLKQPATQPKVRDCSDDKPRDPSPQRPAYSLDDEDRKPAAKRNSKKRHSSQRHSSSAFKLHQKEPNCKRLPSPSSERRLLCFCSSTSFQVQ